MLISNKICYTRYVEVLGYDPTRRLLSKSGNAVMCLPTLNIRGK